MKKSLLVLGLIALVTQGFIKSKDVNERKAIANKEVVNEPLQNVTKGKDVYTRVCSACHQLTGAGIPVAFPPLAKSDYLNKDVTRAIKSVLNGVTGEVTVNGTKFNSVMPSQKTLTDQEIADVLTYVYSSWGNSKKVVKPAMVKALR